VIPVTRFPPYVEYLGSGTPDSCISSTSGSFSFVFCDVIKTTDPTTTPGADEHLTRHRLARDQPTKQHSDHRIHISVCRD
jgi:hypothetical protein